MQINIPTEKISRAGHIAASRIKKIRKWPKWAWFVVLGVIVAGAAAWIILTWPEPPKPDYPIVEAQPVVIDDVEIYGEYAGKISAQQFVEIRARVEGYLEEMLFEEGTYIKKDQVLFIIDPKPYKANVEKAKAQLNKNKALELKAERDLERIRPLFEQNAASRLDLDNAIASYESAKAEVVMSEADLTDGKERHRTGELQHDQSGLPQKPRAQCQSRPAGYGQELESLRNHNPRGQLGISYEGLFGLRRPPGGSQHRDILGTRRDGQP